MPEAAAPSPAVFLDTLPPWASELVRAVSSGLLEMGLSDMIVWVLRENNSARRFYERLGGLYVREQPTTIGSASLQEVSYGWRSLDKITC